MSEHSHDTRPVHPHRAHPAPHSPLARPEQTQPVLGSFDGHDLLAMLLAFSVPGLGYVLLGQSEKAIATLFLIGASFCLVLCGIFPMIIPLMLIYPLSLVDTIMTIQAKKLRPVGKWELLPK